MPQKCPGHPNCAKTFRYPAALRAHLLMCPHAQQRFARKAQLNRMERTQPTATIPLHTAIGLQERTLVGDRQFVPLPTEQLESTGSASSNSTATKKVMQPEEAKWAPKYELLTRRFSDRFGSPFDANGQLSDSCALAVRRGINKGSVLISRRLAPSELVDAEKPMFRREFTNYWALEGPVSRPLCFEATDDRLHSLQPIPSVDKLFKP